MKPRTETQREVAQASKRLAPLTESQRRSAIRKALPHIAKRDSKVRYVCLDCGHSWTADGKGKSDSTACPHCGARLQVDDSRKRNFRFQDYATTVTRSGKYQVLRMWFVRGTYRKGEPAHYWIMEAYQKWIAPDGHTEVVSRQRLPFGSFYIDNWNWCSDLTLKKESNAHTIIPAAVVGRVTVIPEIKRNGFRGDFHGISPAALFRAILTDNRMETLLKCGQTELLRHFAKSDYHLSKHWHCVTIAIRHGYKVKDASLWCDLLSMLDYLGKDTHNPKLICPDNLNEAHDHWQHRQEVRRERERERQARERQMDEEQHYLADKARVQADEAGYQTTKSRFFDICIKDGEILIQPLRSVREFMDEAAKLHHCCFSNRYFAKPQSLILHAVVNGEPVETIEIDLKSLAVVQCRAKYNGISAYHDRIIRLMTAHIGEVAKRIAA